MARIIKEMLNDHINYLYFVFATPLVQEFEKLNALFQKTKEDPQMLIKDLLLLRGSLKSRLYNANGERKQLEEIDFGSKFIQESSNRLTHEDRMTIYVRCKALLEEALLQIEKRMPPAEDIFSKLSFLSLMTVLNQMEKGKVQDLPFQHLINNDVEGQYRKIGLLNWRDEPVFKDDGSPSVAESFWFGVLRSGSSFTDLALDNPSQQCICRKNLLLGDCS